VAQFKVERVRISQNKVFRMIGGKRNQVGRVFRDQGLDAPRLFWKALLRAVRPIDVDAR
jgi:hypothetical protein